MDEIGRFRHGGPECLVRPGLIGASQDPVVREAGVRRLGSLTLWHVTADAVIGWRCLLSSFRRRGARLALMTGHAPLIEVGRCLVCRRLKVRIVTCPASQLSRAGAKAFAHR